MIMYNDTVNWGYRDQTAGVDGIDWEAVDPKIKETWMLENFTPVFTIRHFETKLYHVFLECSKMR